MTKIIYKIINLINDKIYIGQTSQNIKERFRQHCNCGEKIKKYSIISKAIAKYGKSNFNIEVIKQFENITQEYLNKVETYYIHKFNATNHDIGYNICTVGNKPPGMKGLKFSEESKIKSSKSHKEKWAKLTEEQRKEKLYKMRVERNKIGTNFTEDGMNRKRKYQSDRWKNAGDAEKSKWIARLNKMRETNSSPLGKWKNSIRHSLKYLLTSPDNIQFCAIGVQHLKEQFDLDPSYLLKLDKNKINYYKGWKCKKIETI